MRILKSYQSTAFTDLLKSVQKQIQMERKEKEKKHFKKTLNSRPKTHEEKVEHMLTKLTEEVKNLNMTVDFLQNKASNCT